MQEFKKIISVLLWLHYCCQPKSPRRKIYKKYTSM